MVIIIVPIVPSVFFAVYDRDDFIARAIFGLCLATFVLIAMRFDRKKKKNKKDEKNDKM